MSGRGKRVLVYTVTILTAPMPVMPFEKGTREFALAVMVCGAALSFASFYVARGELRGKRRDLLGHKLIASSVITLLFGLFMVAWSAVTLVT